MSYNNTVVVITPVGTVTDQFIEANQLYGYSFGQAVGVSTDGNEPATWRGGHSWMTDAGADFVQMESGRPDTPLQEGETEPKYTGAQVDALYAQSFVSVNPVVNEGQPDEYRPINDEHFVYAIEKEGYKKVVV